MKGHKSKWKTIGHLAKLSSEESGKETIEEALRVLGIYNQPITQELAVLLNEALVRDSPEQFAAILQYLVGSNESTQTQGRIEVEGPNWFVYSQEEHGWQKLE